MLEVYELIADIFGERAFGMLLNMFTQALTKPAIPRCFEPYPLHSIGEFVPQFRRQIFQQGVNAVGRKPSALLISIKRPPLDQFLRRSRQLCFSWPANEFDRIADAQIGIVCKRPLNDRAIGRKLAAKLVPALTDLGAVCCTPGLPAADRDVRPG